MNTQTLSYFTIKILATILITALISTTVFAEDKKNTTETIGDVLQLGLPALAYSSTFLNDDAEGRNEFYWSFFTNVIATQTLKHTVHKNRPDDSDNDAFPSGHTSMAFQAAGFLHKRYGLTYGIPAYLAATYVGWGRKKIKAHETIDVLAGAALGLASSYFFTSPYENFQVAPVLEKDNLGMAVSYRW
jgi:membrane-associated phospholipid phosphatase